MSKKLNIKDLKHKSIFASTVHCVLDETNQDFLAKASVSDLKGIIPDTLLGENYIDLLPIASNLALINAANLNGDSMDGETVLKIAPSIVHKYINWEHKRQSTTMGHITNFAFSKFSTKYKLGMGGEIISANDINGIVETKEPFNISYAGVIYKLVCPEEILNAIMASNDPLNQKYLSISSSWEVFFDSYDIAIGSKYLKDAQIIKADDKKFDELSKYLQCNGGNGQKDGEFIYRVINQGPIFVGAGITLSPASMVAGVVVKDDKNESNSNATANIQSDNKISVITNDLSAENSKNDQNMLTVKDNSNKEISISSVKELTDEVLKLTTANTVQKFFEEEIAKISETWSKEKAEKENALAELEKKNQELQKDIQSTKDSLTTVTTQLAQLNEQIKAQENQNLFNQRMESFDVDYDLTDEDRAFIASDIKEMNEDSFAAYNKKMAVFLKNKKKTNKKQADPTEPDEDDTKKKNKAQASTDPVVTPTDPPNLVKDAIGNATPVAPVVPNTPPTLDNDSFTDKYKAAFGIDNGFKFVK